MLGTEEAKSSEEGQDHAKKVQFIFERIDKDQDGKVTLEEFMTVCTGQLITSSLI